MTSKTPAADRRLLFGERKPKPTPDSQALMNDLRTAFEGNVGDASLPSGAGTLVGVRLQPDLLAQLDKHRGGKTRPQAIRDLLEEHLP